MRRTVIVLAVALWGCGATSQEDLAEAQDTVQASASVAGRVKAVLELVGILPSYTCGDEERTFVGKVIDGAHRDLACAEVLTENLGPGEAVVLAFPDTGCEVKGHEVTGRAVYRFSGGEDRSALAVDLNALSLDGEPVQATVGYGECGDAQTVVVGMTGDVPKKPGMTYAVEVALAVKQGMPLFGDDTLVLAGPGTLTHADGSHDRVTFEELTYDIGDYAPRGGSIEVETYKGHSVKAGFDNVFWMVGTAEVTVDGGEPVTVPIVQ